MKSNKAFILIFVLLLFCVSCNQQIHQNTLAAPSPGVTVAFAYSTDKASYTPTPILTSIPKEGQQTAVARIRATKTEKAKMASPTSTLTPSKTLAPSMTFKPSVTGPPTTTATPISIPTVTPTFDTVQIVTRTSAPAAQCPPQKPDLVPDITSWPMSVGRQYLQVKPALDFLNSGGTIASVIAAFEKEYTYIPLPALQADITGDGVNELLLTNAVTVLIIGCHGGEYQAFLQYEGDIDGVRYALFEKPIDMNLDGIPEIVINEQFGHTNVDHKISIYEWDGNQLKAIIQGKDGFTGEEIPYAEIYGATKLRIVDNNGDGLLEFTLTSDPPFYGTSSYIVGLPWRDETHVYAWNGTLFVLYQIEYSKPEFRFQAVQDGDRATLVSEYTQALDLYQQTIFSDKLDWWSEERWSYEVRLFAARGDNTPTPMPTPIPDSSDYYNLSAYARFRIMLLHVARGFIPEAEIVINTLKEKYPQGQPGYPYAEMATSFWDEYQISSNLGQACDKAVEYATLHPVEILAYLGNGEYARTYYGNQSLEYKPEDVCPFR